LIDVLVLTAAELAVVYGLVLLHRSVLPSWLAATLLIVLAGGLPVAYFTLLEWRSGATLGKRSMRIRVVTEHGAPIGARESLTRNLLRLIDFLPVCYVLGGIVAIASDRSQRLGDMAAGTVAIRTSSPARRPIGPASFTELTASRAHIDGLLPSDVLGVLESYLDRRGSLSAAARVQLAAKIAARIPQDYLPHPLGQSDEQYLIAVHGLHLQRRVMAMRGTR
jgi:uncharacterized RDD family membrane protein YckC